MDTIHIFAHKGTYDSLTPGQQSVVDSVYASLRLAWARTYISDGGVEYLWCADPRITPGMAALLGSIAANMEALLQAGLDLPAMIAAGDRAGAQSTLEVWLHDAPIPMVEPLDGEPLQATVDAQSCPPGMLIIGDVPEGWTLKPELIV